MAGHSLYILRQRPASVGSHCVLALWPPACHRPTWAPGAESRESHQLTGGSQGRGSLIQFQNWCLGLVKSLGLPAQLRSTDSASLRWGNLGICTASDSLVILMLPEV